MKAVKGNKDYAINRSPESYQEAGFDILDDNGQMIANGRGKNVSTLMSTGPEKGKGAAGAGETELKERDCHGKNAGGFSEEKTQRKDGRRSKGR